MLGSDSTHWSNGCRSGTPLTLQLCVFPCLTWGRGHSPLAFFDHGMSALSAEMCASRGSSGPHAATPPPALHAGRSPGLLLRSRVLLVPDPQIACVAGLVAHPPITVRSTNRWDPCCNITCLCSFASAGLATTVMSAKRKLDQIDAMRAAVHKGLALAKSIMCSTSFPL